MFFFGEEVDTDVELWGIVVLGGNRWKKSIKKEWDTVDGSEIRLYHQLRLAW